MQMGARPTRALAFIVAAVLVLMAATVAPSHARSRSVPEFEIVTFSGELFSCDSLKGHPALLIFWAPWCKVCQRELPLLAAFFKEGEAPDLQVLSIGFADVRGSIEAFVKAHPDPYVVPTAYDEDRWVANALKITATPTFVVLDRYGDVALIHRGGGLLQNGEFRVFLASRKE